MELSIFDLSKNLGVTTNTIERWLRQGTLPVSRRGAKIKFHSSELKKWASKHNLVLNLSQEETEPEVKEVPVISLAAAIENGGIYTGVEGSDTRSVLENAIDIISSIPSEFKEDLLTRLIERENALSTGIGNGIAIPHPREPVLFIDEPMVAVCFLKEPTDYNALDNKPVSVVFILLCPDLKMHLKLLSSLSFCLKNPQFLNFLSSQPESVQVIEKINSILNQNPLV